MIMNMIESPPCTPARSSRRSCCEGSSIRPLTPGHYPTLEERRELGLCVVRGSYGFTVYGRLRGCECDVREGSSVSHFHFAGQKAS